MKNAIVSQYKAALKMLTDVTKKCPDNLWDDTTYQNTYWQIVYHTLFYTDQYLSKNEAEFVPWVKHIKGYNRLGSLSRDDERVEGIVAFSKVDLMDYAMSIYRSIDARVARDDDDADSGFSWLTMKKAELHIYTIRHLQHHTGQLIERLHQNGISGIGWESVG